MKTLDEVIAELEDEGLFPDALQWLKMYRSDMQMYSENQKYWEDELMQKIKDFGDAKERYIKRLKELDIGTLNEPLSWDELRQMEGKPVWVEVDEKYKGWVTVGKFYSLFENEDLDAHVNLYYFGRSMEYSKEMYGYYWQAYRKERS